MLLDTRILHQVLVQRFPRDRNKVVEIPLLPEDDVVPEVGGLYEGVQFGLVG